MSGFKDVVESLKLRLKERIVDPFLGSFTLSFIGWNWQGFYYLLFVKTSSHDDMVATISVGQQYFNAYSFIVPVGFSLLYLFGYPWIKRLILAHHLRWEAFFSNLIKEKRGLVAMTSEEVRKLEMNFTHTIETLQTSLNEKNETISKSEGQLRSLYSEITGTDLNLVAVLGSDSMYKEPGFYLRGDGIKPASGVSQRVEELYYVVGGTGNALLGVKVGGVIPIPRHMKRARLQEWFFNRDGSMSDQLNDALCAVRIQVIASSPLAKLEWNHTI